MARVRDWEQRLQTVLENARTKTYRLGEHDCFRVACEVEEAITGRASRWGLWAGRYRTEEEALRLIMERGGFDKAASDWFGGAPVPITQARRGDICAYRDQTRMRHLGVCVGAQVLVLGADGLMPVPLSACRLAWRIG